MSFLSKVELKSQLEKMGIKVKGNYIKKSDLKTILAQETKTIFLIVVGGKDIHCAYTNKQEAEKHKKYRDDLGQDERVWKSWPHTEIVEVELRDRFGDDDLNVI